MRALLILSLVQAMHISVFDLFKIGIGPSSSHTMGPMKAALDFVKQLQMRSLIPSVNRVEVHFYGSLSATGIGHGTDRAILLGLMGYEPDSIDPDIIMPVYESIKANQQLMLAQNIGQPQLIEFDYEQQMIFESDSLPYHPNALTILAYGDSGELYQNTYYSIGGGFIIDQQESQTGAPIIEQEVSLPYEFGSAKQLLQLCNEHGLSVSQLMMENEKCWRSESEIELGLVNIWNAMNQCIEKGLSSSGTLPGGLDVKRRAAKWFQSIQENQCENLITTSLNAMDWVNLYALAVNEENAAGGRVVTAPTNGAAGIVPSVLRFYMSFHDGATDANAVDFLLAAAAIGILCKKNASISGAEVGCQGEVGSACAMAAAGLAQVLNASPEQLENAAEIALEHNLGLTCDPVAGLVQVPCIERNAIASVKAINAAQMGVRGDGNHYISLDKVILTMRETGRDMMAKYKETSEGGLAVNLTEC